MPTGSKNKRPSVHVICAVLKAAQFVADEGGRDLAALSTQVPDPDRPRSPPPPPLPKSPERDDPEQDEPQEPDQEKPPPLPPWLNQAYSSLHGQIRRCSGRR